jgi:MFS family permease
MIALLLLPSDPAVVFWPLIVVFLIDSALNAGIAIVSNGFLLKQSPAVNRTMYIAAGTALAGMVGGAASILAGAALAATTSWQAHLGTVTVGNFQLVFATSVVLRLISVVYALRIQEPESQGTSYVVTQLVGATPLRVLRFPVGLYGGFRNTRAFPNPGPGIDDTVPSGTDAVEHGEEVTMARR